MFTAQSFVSRDRPASSGLRRELAIVVSIQSLRRPAFSRALTCARDVVVDLSELSFADSSLMLDLAALARRLRMAGGTVRLRSPQPHILRLIELVGLDRLPGVVLETPV